MTGAGSGSPLRAATHRLILSASILALASAAHAQKADFLIFRHPDRLIFFDAYQESLPASDRQSLPSFIPIRVLSGRMLLSDSVTRCDKVEIEGDVLYLLRTEGGHIAQWDSAGLSGEYRQKTLLGDTVRILAPSRYRFRPAAQAPERFAQEGESFVRYFSDGGEQYARTLSERPQFGWLNLDRRSMNHDWTLQRADLGDQAISPSAKERIVARVQRSNRSLREFYSTLNAETRQRIPAPQWRVDSTRTSLRINLRPATAGPLYVRSTAVLAEEIQTYLIGSGYDVTVLTSAILVGRR